MNIKKIPTHRLIPAGILLAVIAYSVFYFNYFETPTGDYIGNIRGPVTEYTKGNFPGKNFKFLPFYPLLLSFLTRLNPVESGDPVYLTAMVLNMILLVPYIIIVFLLYRRFLSEKAARAAVLFLGINLYTVYMAINSELEMSLTLLIVLSLYLTLKGSRFSYAGAFLSSLTKWDAVFIVPAVMFGDFFYKKKRILAIVLGALATSGAAAWLLLSYITTHGQTYVSEIAHRGPNVYRFIIDCFLVAGGFLQWMGLHAWYAERMPMKIGLMALLTIPGLVTLVCVSWGAVLVWKQNRKDFAPILIFAAGFLLIHMVYQNTKDRYVMPILWILTLFIFYGITRGLAPRLAAWFSTRTVRSGKVLLGTLLAPCGVIYAVTIGFIVIDTTVPHLIFTLVFAGLMAAVILEGADGKKLTANLLLILACGVLINLSVYYGVRALDHHGLSRVEFKQAALWYKDHAKPGDKMLISETNVPMYYSGFGEDKFAVSFFIKGRTIRELVPELKAMKVTHVFVDDFYIRRLPIKDPNAIDRRAWVFQEIRDHGVQSGHFTLIKTFHTKGDIVSYLFILVP
jgi:hypothetical protein